MKRRLFNILAALSLLLWVAVVALWIWSYGHRDAMEFDRDAVRWRVVSENGRLRIDNDPQRMREEHAYLAALRRSLDEDNRLHDEWKEAFDQWNPLGVDRENRALKARMDRAAAARKRNFLPMPSPLTPRVSRSVPHAAIAGAATILPAAWAAWRASSSATRRRRRMKNQCPACAYSLTGNISGVCPECGTPAKSLAGGLARRFAALDFS